jgi:hypothetical protein
MTGGVPRSADDIESENIVSIGQGSQLSGRGDGGQITVAGIAGGIGGRFQDPRRTSDVIRVAMGQDHMPDVLPPEAYFAQRGFDPAFTSRYPGVDNGCLAAPSDDVGRDKTEIDSLKARFPG